MNRRRFPFLVLVLALLASAALAVDYPLTVTDDLGREVTLEAPPERVVTMMPSHTETACALDACELLVGVDQHSNHPPEVEELPHFGSGFNPNVEAIVEAQPDLVLVDEYSEMAATLGELGLTVYAGIPETYEDALAAFDTAGRLLDREEEARALSERVQQQVDAVAAQVADREAPTVYYELDATPYSVGPDSFIGTLIRRAGGDNIVEAGMGEFPQLDPEFIIEQNPEIIVLADAPHGVTEEAVAERPAWDNLQAVQTGEVHELSQEQADMLSRAGPRLGQAVELLARLFHPDAF